MKAVRVHGLGDRAAVRVDEVEGPVAGVGEIVVAVAAASVNLPDVLMLDGKYQIRPELPFVLGKDGAGTVTAVGEGVVDLEPGDRVMFYIHYGAFAEQVAMPRRNCFKLPDSLDFGLAAAMGVTYQAAWVALAERAGLAPGEVVLVTGAAGGVGLAAVALAKALGAGQVLAGMTTLSKRDAVLAAGADHIIDMSGPDLADSLRAQTVQAAGREVDVVIDVVGGDVFDACLRTLTFNGRIVVVGFAGGRIADVKTNHLLLKNISAVGSSINAYYAHDIESVRSAQQAMFRLFQEGKLAAPHIDARFPLERVAEAIARLEGRSVAGKIVLDV